MIKYFKKRKIKKELKEYLHAARHARHMRDDLADPDDLAELIRSEEEVRDFFRTDQGDLDAAIERMSAATDRVYPLVNNSGIRENVEVVIVALAAAMAIRAFFFQPFKIPTGSMQPSLNGITVEAQPQGGFLDHQPLKFAKWLVTGTSYKEVRAKVTGLRTSNVYATNRDKYAIDISGVPHLIPSYMGSAVELKSHYTKGDVICRAKVITGDHILVNKMKYNFMRPRRGDIAVFDTKHILDSRVRPDTFYIKRMVGLPGEKIQIQDREIVADGRIVREPPIFEQMITDPSYQGHANAELLATPDDFIQLKDDQYLMMGDNTFNSLDGRFFGGVPQEDFQGPAFFVYWPFRSHWGLIH